MSFCLSFFFDFLFSFLCFHCTLQAWRACVALAKSRPANCCLNILSRVRGFYKVHRIHEALQLGVLSWPPWNSASRRCGARHGRKSAPLCVFIVCMRGLLTVNLIVAFLLAVCAGVRLLWRICCTGAALKPAIRRQQAREARNMSSITQQTSLQRNLDVERGAYGRALLVAGISGEKRGLQGPSQSSSPAHTSQNTPLCPLQVQGWHHK